MDCLILDLRGPLRSWGSVSLGDDRWTEMRPTASGILGLVAACVGIDFRDDARLREWHQSWLVVTASATAWSSGASPVPMRPRVRTDFQTARNSLCLDGTRRDDPIVSHRGYLECAREAAAIILKGEASAGLLETTRKALLRPVFTPFLGRLCNPLTEPLLAGRGHFSFPDGAYAEVAWRLLKQLGTAGLMEEDVDVHDVELSCDAGLLDDWIDDWHDEAGRPAVTRQDAHDVRHGAARAHRTRMCDYIRVHLDDWHSGALVASKEAGRDKDSFSFAGAMRVL